MQLKIGTLARVIEANKDVQEAVYGLSVPQFIGSLKEIAADPVRAGKLLTALQKLDLAVREVAAVDLLQREEV